MATPREQLMRLFDDEYIKGVNDGYAKGVEKGRALPPDLLPRWRKVRDEFTLSGDTETASVIQMFIDDLLKTFGEGLK